MKKKHWILVGLGTAIGIAATVFLLNKKNANEEDEPPKNAPQVDIDNPGDQSDFPKSASESELG